MTDLNEVSTNDLVDEIKARGDWPNIGDFTCDVMIDDLKTRGDWLDLCDYSDAEVKDEAKYRDMSIIDVTEMLKDEDALEKSIDYARWGDLTSCGYFLIKALPGLWPIRKVPGQ
jgi:hypothetical protein